MECMEVQLKAIARWLIARSLKRQPDFVVGGTESPYLNRWWLIPRNPIFNIYLHEFLRSDDDRALHDHPWINCSILLSGQYCEHTIAAGGIHHRTMRKAGDIKFRLGSSAHRIELTHGPCWTLFITGPRYRNWGFHCVEAGWIPWQQFVDERDAGAVGKGCGD